jgi:hypothetical protein
MTPEQRELARHALGLPNKQKKSYRNRYVCEESDPVWSEFVRLGWATMRPAASVPFGGCAIFYLTKAGAELALDKGEKLDPEDFPT